MSRSGTKGEFIYLSARYDDIDSVFGVYQGIYGDIHRMDVKIKLGFVCSLGKNLGRRIWLPKKLDGVVSVNEGKVLSGAYSLVVGEEDIVKNMASEGNVCYGLAKQIMRV